MYDRKNTKNLAPLKARQGDCVVGFLNKKPIIKAEGFHPIDLNEDNVQAIFDQKIQNPSFLIRAKLLLIVLL